MPSISATGDSYMNVPNGKAVLGKGAFPDGHGHTPDNSQQENGNGIKPGEMGKRETPGLLVSMCVSASNSGGSQELLLPLSSRGRLEYLC